ncbi:MAG: GTPase ObgE [Solobacterium sp.]|nr:GTPase ObgE [Solobacterium sp.]
MIDLVNIKIKEGDGGKGCVAFRHEKYYPNGGPFGGDGGRGGNVYFAVDTNETTLTKLRFTKSIRAGNGGDGMTKKMHGKDGDDVTVKVPLGTMIRNAKNGDLLADLTRPNQTVLIAKGGRGGLGNIHFATARNNTPEYAQPGEIGESFELQLELRLLADAALLGFPSVGKSTFLSVVSNAKPQIAAYPFTTLEPSVGVVRLPDERSFVLADMPGLIEGAGDGKGLGHEFLRHISRCRVLVHVIDMTGENQDPIEAYEIINQELKKYDISLENKKQIVVANKMDMNESIENLKVFKEKYPDLEIYETSTLLHEGMDQVLYAIMDAIEQAKIETPDEEASDEVVVYRYEAKKPDYEILNLGNHRWKVQSDKIERLVSQVDFNKEDDTYQFALTLKKMGIDQALYDAGVRVGDEVIIGTYIMNYEE